ncbi:MAG TPA: hypothetical protein VL485_18125 [Ktedonobacteraceae bacterium]|jgi:hypothetical protein|nr:hypothetical protein [Ktedonobacteraceae bacterium]
MRIAKLLLIAGLGLWGCAILSSCDLGSSQADVLPMLHQVSPVDSSPGKLGVNIVLNEDQNAIDGKVAIEMRFMDAAIRNPNDVQFTDRETITCNGVPLVYDVTSYTYDADILSTSNNYRCLYTSHGHTSTLAVPIQTRLAPRYVLRGPTLNIRYNPSNKKACFVQVVASDSLHVQNGLSHPDDGLYSTMDVGELRGAGKLQFTRTCKVVRPSVFHAVSVSYQASRSIDVIWKHAAR